MSRFAPVLPAACTVVYLATCSAFAGVWEVTHDEGITWLQTFGSLNLPRWPEAPVAMSDLLILLTGQGSGGWAEVVSALRGHTGMHPPVYYFILNSWGGLFGTSPIARFLEQVLRALMETEQPLYGEPCALLHDPCAVMAAIFPNCFRYEYKRLAVCVEDGRERGRMMEKNEAPGVASIV